MDKNTAVGAEYLERTDAEVFGGMSWRLAMILWLQNPSGDPPSVY